MKYNNNDNNRNSQEKCKHFKDENVREVFELVASDEMLKSDGKLPDFERITTAIDNAFHKSFAKFNPTQSEWIKKTSGLSVP